MAPHTGDGVCPTCKTHKRIVLSDPSTFSCENDNCSTPGVSVHLDLGTITAKDKTKSTKNNSKTPDANVAQGGTGKSAANNAAQTQKQPKEAQLAQLAALAIQPSSTAPDPAFATPRGGGGGGGRGRGGRGRGGRGSRGVARGSLGPLPFDTHTEKRQRRNENEITAKDILDRSAQILLSRFGVSGIASQGKAFETAKDAAAAAKAERARVAAQKQATDAKALQLAIQKAEKKASHDARLDAATEEAKAKVEEARQQGIDLEDYDRAKWCLFHHVRGHSVNECKGSTPGNAVRKGLPVNLRHRFKFRKEVLIINYSDYVKLADMKSMSDFTTPPVTTADLLEFAQRLQLRLLGDGHDDYPAWVERRDLNMIDFLEPFADSVSQACVAHLEELVMMDCAAADDLMHNIASWAAHSLMPQIMQYLRKIVSNDNGCEIDAKDINQLFNWFGQLRQKPSLPDDQMKALFEEYREIIFQHTHRMIASLNAAIDFIYQWPRVRDFESLRLVARYSSRTMPHPSPPEMPNGSWDLWSLGPVAEWEEKVVDAFERDELQLESLPKEVEAESKSETEPVTALDEREQEIQDEEMAEEEPMLDD